jgi:hypothetical protein
MRAVHQNLGLDDRDEIGFLAKRGVSRQDLSGRFDGVSGGDGLAGFYRVWSRSH